MKACPCGSERSFDTCCEPLIAGSKKPETAEQLMRARYSAFTTAAVDYIMTTTSPEQRKNYVEKDVRAWAENSDWLGLQIIKTEAGQATDNQGTVEFIARYTEKGNSQAHHELASFTRIDGEWFFDDGVPVRNTTPIRVENKIGRNDPCTCGSGKKYKKCCGK